MDDDRSTAPPEGCEPPVCGRSPAGGMAWSPHPLGTATLVVAAVVLGAAALSLDAAGRLLVGAATLLALGVAGRDVVARPRLAVDADGVVVRTGTGRRHLPWAHVRIGVRATRRFGLRSRLLELDTAAGPDDTGVLVLLGRRDLGADPEEVARTLRGLAPRTG
ncbi:PH domain-containing protein [Geodermatophilus sp. YIM 151500]|uniref:PH domain-containing protein n=1 Tax=Geodermatophilus sp. YIM 151500 TaxID=2984531 RepID=UPI0021E42ED4|nr:PH domain-containing protein [Geodermatophilus sp. YIM 151500]MCV2491240.1 PH domain-containing protein [Geodermatophilus sp. YIM 151500]